MLVDRKKYELPGDPDRDAYVVGVSGGADSSAVAVIMHKLFPDLDIKYVFIDTFAEAPAIYSSIEALEKYIGKKVIKIENGGRNVWHDQAIQRPPSDSKEALVHV